MENEDPTLCRITGWIKALEYGVRALIISHPEPQKLLAIWQALLPLVSDVHSISPTVQSVPAFHQGLTEGLAELTATIERRAPP
jgi:hypothetical protein